jgi:hypothetical protein
MERERLADVTARVVLAEWSKVDPDSVAENWGRLLPKVTAMVQASQTKSADLSNDFMRDMIGALEAEIDPDQFARQTPDGRNLMGVLARAIPTALWRRDEGDSTRTAMARAGSFLNMVVRTVVADTGRQADQAAMVGNTKVTSYVRVVELPACARCIILAGREYSVSTGFQRHPNCDCTMEPVTHGKAGYTVDAKDMYDRMSADQRRKVFGEAGTKAINDGANIYSIVNARKAMDTVEMFGRQVQVTHVGTGSKKAPKRPPRLMPEEIYRLANGDRNQAIRLLYKNGYLR